MQDMTKIMLRHQWIEIDKSEVLVGYIDKISKSRNGDFCSKKSEGWGT